MSDDFDPEYGTAVELQEGLRRIVSPNPSPMTFLGTNTYLLGESDIIVIDPGPDHKAHLNSILDAISPRQHISRIIVTHSHLDHSPLARPLSEISGAPILAFGGPSDGRSEVMRRLAADGFTGGGEGVDASFSPDLRLHDGEIIEASDCSLEVIHTPGHLGNHICLAWGDTCFTADHVMGWASSLVSPPDGDLTDFMSSCEKLRARPWQRFYPGHGGPIDNPVARLDWLIAHRRQRERDILAALAEAPANAAALTKLVYTDTPTALLPAAQRNVLAHLIDLYGKSLVIPLGQLTANATFRIRSDVQE